LARRNPAAFDPRRLFGRSAGRATNNFRLAPTASFGFGRNGLRLRLLELWLFAFDLIFPRTFNASLPHIATDGRRNLLALD
jgi:hypothetical protein